MLAPSAGRTGKKKDGWVASSLADLTTRPILLFFACLGLFVTYAPFAEAFSHSTSPEAVWEAVGPLWFSRNSHVGSSNTAALRNPLLAYFECAAGTGLAVMAVRGLLLRRQTAT